MALSTRYGFADAPTSSIVGDSSLGWTTATGALSAAGTSLTVASSAAFPAALQFDIVIGVRNTSTGVWTNAEVRHVTVVSGTTWTVAAGALDHASGESISHILTAEGVKHNPGALTDSGDMPYLNASGRMARLAAPVDGAYSIAWTSGVPTWTSASSGGLTFPDLASPPASTPLGSTGAKYTNYFGSGTMLSTDHSSFGKSAVLNGVDSLGGDAYYALFVGETMTTDVQSTQGGLSVVLTVDPSTDSSSQQAASSYSLVVPNTNNNDLGELYGTIASVFVGSGAGGGTGVVDAVYGGFYEAAFGKTTITPLVVGLHGRATNYGMAGTTTLQKGVASLSLSLKGVITTANGFSADAPYFIGSSAIGTYNGLHVEAPSNFGGTATLTEFNGVLVDEITTATPLPTTGYAFRYGAKFSVNSAGAVVSASTVTATDHVWTGTKTANFVLAGPTTGSAAVPAFRALVAADIPAGAYGGVTSLAGTSNQITASAATGAVTLSIPTNPIFSGTALTFPGELSIASGKILTASKSLTLDGTDSTTMTFPTTSATIARTDAANTFTGQQTFSTGITIGTSGNLFGGTNLLEQRNSTAAQTLNVYNTFTDASNYERGFVRYSSNVLQIGHEGTGTGTNSRTIAFRTNGFNPVTIDTSNMIMGVAIIGQSMSFSGSGSTQATAPVSITNGSFSSTSGTRYGFNFNHTYNPSATSTMVVLPLYINPTINYSAGTPGGGSYEAVKIAVVETALPTGTNYLIRASAGAAGTTDKFSVTNAGLTTWADAANLVFGTSTGTKIGTATTQLLGLWNTTPIVQPASANQAAFTDGSGGVAAASLVDVTTTGLADPVKVNANFATISVLLLAMRTAMVNFGSMKGAA